MTVEEDAVLICAFCAREYPADENFYEPYCSAECREEDEGGEGDEA